MNELTLAGAALVAALALACGPAEEMWPGASCGSCHTRPAPRGILAGNAPEFGAGGTLYADARGKTGLAGATVDVIDNDGKKVSMMTNRVGNFYTTTKLVPPLRVTVTSNGRTIVAENGMASGDCNACHTSAAKQGRMHQ